MKHRRAIAPWRELTIRGFVAVLPLLTPLTPTPAHAATDLTDDLSNNDLYYGELPVVLSATRLRQPVAESPVAVTVIDRDMIDASGAREIAELFRLVPGFLVTSVNSHQYSVGYHGMFGAFSRRMQVLIDGRSVYVPIFGGVRWSDLPLAMEDIERIEVVRGPNAATYGPNSFQGIISITTRHAADTAGTLVKAATGSDDYDEITVRATGGERDYNYRLTARYAADTLLENRRDDKEVSMVNFRGDYQLTARDNFELQTGANWGPRGEGRGRTDDPFRDLDAESWFLQGRWRRDLGAGEELSLLGYINSFQTEDAFSFDDDISGIPAKGFFDNFRRSVRYDIELQHALRPTDGLDLVWGVELRRDEAHTENLINRAATVHADLRRLFANANWRIAHAWRLQVGAMAEDNDLVGTEISPRLSLGWQPAPAHALRLTWSRATRTPALLEAEADYQLPVSTAFGDGLVPLFIKTDTVVSEEVNAWELGYHFAALDNRLTTDLKWFKEELENLIGIAPTTGQAQIGALSPVPISAATFANADDAVIKGVEWELRWRPSPRDRLILGGSLLSATSTDRLADYSASVPDRIYNLMWIRQWPDRLTTSLLAQHVGEMTFLDDDANPLPPQTRIDLRIAQKTNLAGFPAEISFVIQNLGGEYTVLEGSVYDTRAYLSLSMTLR